MSISDGESTVALPPSKPTTLLAAMLLRPGAVVSTEFLQRAVWGETPPATAKATLHTYVMRLRRLFAKFGISNDAIETMPGGYRLPVDGSTLDLARFRELLRASERAEAPEEESRLLGEALALWEGPPISNVQSEVLHRDEVPALREEWLRAAERRFDVELSLGRCRQALPELRSVARAHPGHERFWERLIEALYRTGRQSDALAEYRTVKEYLSTELGVDPGPSLRRLEMTILRGESMGPDAPDAPAPSEAARGAAPAPGPYDPGLALPADLPDFTGRERESAELVEQLTADRGGPALAVISGPPGIGKTALAVHIAQQVRDAFPDGQYFVRVGPEDPDGGDAAGAPRPLPASAANGGDGERRTLVVLDDVSSMEQIQAALPTAKGSAAVITSRMSLAGLAASRGAGVYRLGALAPGESRALLSSVLGHRRVAAEQGPTDELAELCGHFPLSLRIAATRLLLRPRHQIADDVAWLRDDPVGRLSVVGTPDMSLAQTFGTFLGRLSLPAIRACQTLGNSPQQLLSLDECAAALRLSLVDASAVLDQLIDASLLEGDAPGQYRMPALLRAFVRRDAGVALSN
ncbi:BTAD domain-containing putative transcriptional regulator [Streptomyces sp. NPDC050617]|uniref:BTAD domain-containing putative transcriptional regulator n=1 Tax=Streptomyces sp. NPDC050617 TaxID=3154628 RepID=UPI00343BC418